MENLYHITTKFDYIKAKDKGFYDFCALKTEGFIHLSFKHQVLETADRYFKGKDNLIVFEINPATLEQSIKVENTVGGEELFPHLYSELPVSVIEKIYDLTETSSGFKMVLQS
tara:strand:+ start:372 stop:710 length:339 start_codon:yes stop_codon:yes gene_type:complete